MYKEVELRKLPSDILCKVVNILEINNDWKKLMSIIPKSLQTNTDDTKYNNEHIRIIEEHAKENHLKCTEILLNEWSTSGRVRPTLTHLKEILSKARIFRAADEIADILGDSKPVRPSFGPAATVPTNVTEILDDESKQQRLRDMGSINKSHLNELCNKTTKEMKSVSDMIQFPETIITTPITIKNSYRNIKIDLSSASDMMKFTQEQPSQESMNVPDLSAMYISKNSESIGINTQIDTDASISSYVESKTESHMHNPENYQRSFPNIDISMSIDSAILQDAMLMQFDYSELESITGNFSDVLLYGPNGLKGRIGSGGFGDVFVGNHVKYGLLAIKKGHHQLLTHRKPKIAMTLFNAEVKFLSQFRHVNIVPIFGFSMDGPAPCIVCEYIDGGSLQENIAAKILSEDQRINIMIGTAEGLKYLHTSKTHLDSQDGKSLLRAIGENESQNTIKNFVHGDVKTANILLTSDCVPKLCDFGLAKQYDATYMTTSVMGTSAYMAPEGLHGTITQKIDIFSFGIVLLELLTGLKPIFPINDENFHIKLYVEENTVNNDIEPLLDTVPTWTKANEIYSLARSCLESNRKSRPTITEVCDILHRIKN